MSKVRQLGRLALLLAAAGSASAQDPAADAPAPSPTGRNLVAAVIGLSTYQNLPKEVHLDFARSDAALVANALEEQAHFTEVFLLRDSEATQQSIRELLRTKAAQLLGPDDVFVLYFVGHGVGADLDIPTLLAYDSTLENGQNDGLEIQTFARDLQTWTPAGTTLIVTDAIHRNQLDGIYFYGPSADQWPAMPRGTMILSSTPAGVPGKDGAFGELFARGIGGGADSNVDRKVTAGELYKFLSDQLAPTGQVPMAAGDFDVDMALGGEVSGEPVLVEPTEPQWPDIEVSAAKFVWTEGASQLVQCRDEPIVACSPSCYVRTFKAGPCAISAIIDGVEMTGSIIVLEPGKYDCARKGGNLVCTGP